MWEALLGPLIIPGSKVGGPSRVSYHPTTQRAAGCHGGLPPLWFRSPLLSKIKHDLSKNSSFMYVHVMLSIQVQVDTVKPGSASLLPVSVMVVQVYSLAGLPAVPLPAWQSCNAVLLLCCRALAVCLDKVVVSLLTPSSALDPLHVISFESYPACTARLFLTSEDTTIASYVVKRED